MLKRNCSQFIEHFSFCLREKLDLKRKCNFTKPELNNDVTAFNGFLLQFWGCVRSSTVAPVEIRVMSQKKTVKNSQPH